MTPCLMTITIWPPVMVFTTSRTCLEPVEGLSSYLHAVLPRLQAHQPKPRSPGPSRYASDDRMRFLGVHLLTG